MLGPMIIKHRNLATEEVIFESDNSKSYEIRRPKGLTDATVRRFLKCKPRYRRYRGLLVMSRPV